MPQWNQSAAQLAEEYDLSLDAVEAALAYFQSTKQKLIPDPYRAGN
jgi:uncharacterized protein (DUF433 family)